MPAPRALPVRALLLLPVAALALGLRPLLAQITPANSPAPAAPAPPASRAQADRHFAEKSYALALPEYQSLLKRTPPNAPDRTLIEYRVAVALGAAQQWDAAFAAWDTFLAAHEHTPLWAGRGHYQRALLLNLAPHQGYKVGARLYRGSDYPHLTGAEKPEQVHLQSDDRQAALADFEAAVSAYERATQPVTFTVSFGHGEAGKDPVSLQIKDPDDRFVNPSRPVTFTRATEASAAEQTDLCFDLAKFLPGGQQRWGWGGQGWGSDDDWKAARKTDWAIHPSRAYNPAWPQPKKVLFLLARAETLNPNASHPRVLAEIARALYVAQNAEGWTRREWVQAPGKPSEWRVTQTVPYVTLDPAAILARAADTYPHDPQAPQIVLILAQWAERGGDSVAALKLYRLLASRYPASKWAPDAGQAIAEILRPTVGLNTGGPQPAGRPATLTVSSRNLQEVTLRAYKVPLETVLTRPARLADIHQLTEFSTDFGNLANAPTLGPLAAQWTDQTGDKGKHKRFYDGSTTPLSEPGAYLVVADGDGGKVRAGALVLISDLAVMKKTDRDNVLCFVADASSGRPVPGADVVVRQYYRDDQNRDIVRNTRGVTGLDGTLLVPTVKENRFNIQTEAFASAPQGRYALTGQGYWYGGDVNTQAEIKTYAYTDRPVYRPGQTVSLRALLARREAGTDFKPLAVGTSVRVSVSGPRGGSIYDQTLAASRFGSINGSFDLPTGAALGEYSVSIDVPGHNEVMDGGSRFRVEEYKRPEYLVAVMPSTTQARFGDRVTATVKATYYAGPPVAGAKVSYRVFRSPYYPSYHFPQAYDWLYHADEGGYANQNADQGELVTSGEGVTDAHRALAVSFTALKGTRDYAGDYAYTVKADVVDSSRRLVGGEGILHVTRQAFYAYLNVPQGFYQMGDKAQIELRTLNPDEQPVSVSGTLTAYLQTYDAPKLVETAVHTQDLTTDSDGKALTTWQASASGQYRLEFKATDKFAQVVLAGANVWITGGDLGLRRFHVGGITILTDKTTYGEGETAHLLIVSDQPDNWVLLTSEASSETLSRAVVHVAGRARTLDVPITRADAPNFAFGAVAVRDYQFFRWQQEVFVPPARQFLNLAVSSDRAEYKPGDVGTFHVRATDALGRPVASEVSLAVVDSSIYYIQKEYAPDIRLFYYGQRRAVNINVDTSDSGQLQGASESDLPVTPFTVHGIHIVEMGRLPDEWPYPYYGYYGNYTGRLRRFGGGFGAIGALFRNRGDDSSVGQVVTDVYERREKSQPNNLYQFPGLVFGQAAATADAAAGYVHIKGSDFNQSGFDVDGIAITPGGSRPAPARVRRDFRDTAFWTPAVVTSAVDGTATLTVHFPDTLTTWKATARGLTPDVRVGAGESEATTNKHLLVRLESPRFFVQRDRVTLSAIVRNDLATAKAVRVSLQTNADILRPGSPGVDAVRTITVPAHGEKRVDWDTQVVGDGRATVRMVAQTDEESDAVEQTFPALAYGVQKFVTAAGVLQSDQNHAGLTVTLPHDRRAGSAALLVQINPSLAATTLDALPYLADYPYGCVEQTLSRFLPSVVVAHTLKDAGVNLDTLHARALALAAREKAGTPFGQAHAAALTDDPTGYSYPSGTPGVLKTPELAEGLWHTDRWRSPVFDPVELQSMVDDGLSRLVSMQRADSGWGWWGGSAESDPYMSAYVVYGLATARAAGVAVPEGVLERGNAYLAGDLKNRDDERDLAVWGAFALSQTPETFPASGRAVVQVVYGEREWLSPYGQALLSLTLHDLGRTSEAETVCRNLRNTARIDAENGTASWAPSPQGWWYWYNDDVETDAWALKAYTAILPHDDLTPMLVKWLVQNQHGSIWHSTKATAMAVYALTDYIKANNELAPDYTVKVALGDKVSRTFTVNRDNALLFDNQFLVPDALLADGRQTISVTKTGAGRLYYSTAVQYVTTEENITHVGTEMKIQRRYYRLTPKAKSVADYAGGAFNVLDYTRTGLADGASLKSGDLIEVELVLDSKNEYDYCCFEDMKPAGCEPLALRSGESYGDGLCSDMELRDTKTAFFVDHLPQGTRVLRYRLRAEVPGAFHALPTNGYAMYAPEVRALSDGWHVTVSDAETTASAR